MAGVCCINTVIPEAVVPAKVYDKWWVRRFVVRAPELEQPVSVNVELQKYCEVDGIKEFGEDKAKFEVEDLFAKAATDPELATIIDSLFAKIKQLGDEQGVL